VDAAVFGGQRVAGLLDHRFSKAKWNSVIDEFLDHFADDVVPLCALCCIQAVDHLDDPAVLGVDDIDAGIQVRLPDEVAHALLHSPDE
jgi:hypothetical protein